MAGAQIPSSVTILNSLKGFQGISLTNFATSALSQIAAGSVVEIAGAFFNFPADETINASTWTSITSGNTAYIALVPAGTAGSQTVTAEYTATAPVWRDDMQGWYASAASVSRVIGSVYKVSATAQTRKVLLQPRHSPSWDDLFLKPVGDNVWRGQIERITSGLGNWTVPDGVYRIRVTCVGGGGGGGGGGGNNFPGTAGSSGGSTIFTGATTGLGGGGGNPGNNTTSPARGGVGSLGSSGSSGGVGTLGVGGSGGGAGGVGGAVASIGSSGNYGGGGGGGGGNSNSQSSGSGGGGTNISLATTDVIEVMPLDSIAYSVGVGGSGGDGGVAGGAAGGNGGSGIIIIEY